MKLKYFCLALIAIIAGSLIYYWPTLVEIQALRKYAATFEADAIDENFRSLYQLNASISIPNTGLDLPLEQASTATPLPSHFDFYGEQREFKDFLERTHTTGLLVIKDGFVICEDYARGNTAESQVLMASVSKSMTSMLIGVAVDEGKINLDELVTNYAPALKGSGYEGVTVRQTLNMSTGIKWSEDYGDFDSEIVRSLVAMTVGSLDQFAASMTTDHPAGTRKLYASINTHVLSMVLRGATGESYQRYFERNLWSKIGAEDDVKMLVDSLGEPLAFGGANIRLRDMARFGLVYLNEGRNLAGEQIVSSDWVHKSYSPEAQHLSPIDQGNQPGTRFGYANHWWLPPTQDGNDFAAIGIYGQYIYINPKYKILIAKTSAYPDYLLDGGVMDLESLVAFQSLARQLATSPQ